MSTLCGDPVSCPGGNCVGCQNGHVWCNDPQCAPFCTNCPTPQQHDFIANFIMGIIIAVLLAILFIVWFIYGPQLIVSHDDHDRANVLVSQQTKNSLIKTS